jgi:cellulose synthase/poly-beta-1,6-N-acetylglucosamine synthase-like glycosyltransferase/peptidoglycan/xylan/chitin deacetylase (PgdA/CDA1 family)
MAARRRRTGTAGPAAKRADRSPSTHWGTLVLLLIGLSSALFVDGYAHNRLGRSTTTARGPIAGLHGAGPILDLSRREVRSVPVPSGQVALTFDDGPDPRWTPRVLEVLARHHVRATFFVVGTKVASHPGIARRIRRAGHEIGSHTFTHADMGSASRIRRSAELSLTQVVLAGATGISTSLLRLPYSSEPEELTQGEVRAAREAARYGYLLVATTNDGEDWRRPGVDVIVGRSLPRDNEGAVILLHDSGGDRHQTVAALERIIEELEHRGDRFVTISDLLDQPTTAVNRPVSGAARVQGRALLVALVAAHLITKFFTVLMFPIVVLALLRAIIVVFFAARHARSRQLVLTGYRPPVTVVVPAYNEAVGIEATLRSLVATGYPGLEVIVVDDGSEDGTGDVAERLALPNVRVLRQANAGKAAALNLGIANASHDAVVMVDGDTVFEPDTLARLVQPLADPTVGAVSGNTKVGNRSRLIGRWQHIEYVLGFNLDRRMFDALRCMPTVPGAVGAFRRQALDAVGGMSGDTLAEDTDITMALNRHGWRVVYEEAARAWTEAPATLGALWRQRYRWSYGTMQSMWKHRGALREGNRLGRVGIPYVFAFQVVLPLLGPAIDLFAIYGLVFRDPLPVLAYWVGFNVITLLLGVFAFRLDREPLTPLWALVLQQFVYRQLMYLVVIQSVRAALGGHRLVWHRSERRGLPPGPLHGRSP